MFEGTDFNGDYKGLHYQDTLDVLQNNMSFKSMAYPHGMPFTLFEKPFYQGYRKCYGGIYCTNSLEEDFPNGVGSIKLGGWLCS